MRPQKCGTSNTLIMRFPIFNERCMLTTYSLYMPALIGVQIKILKQLTKLKRLKGQYSKQPLFIISHILLFRFFYSKTLPYFEEHISLHLHRDRQNHVHIGTQNKSSNLHKYYNTTVNLKINSCITKKLYLQKFLHTTIEKYIHRMKSLLQEKQAYSDRF